MNRKWTLSLNCSLFSINYFSVKLADNPWKLTNGHYLNI